MQQQILDYAHYNLWANRQIISLFETLTDEHLEQEIVSSFPSVRSTFLHLWSVEYGWLERLHSISPATFPGKNFEGTNRELFDLLLSKSAEIIAFLEEQPDTYFTTPLEFTLITAPGNNHMAPKDILQHLFNHQTMHRGQLITMARQLGVTTFPRTDYVIWWREQAAKK